MSWLENFVAKMLGRVEKQLDALTTSKEYIAATDAYSAGDFKTALPLFEALAAKSHPRSAAMAGKMYLFGEGARENGAKAVKYLEIAVAGGNDQAVSLLGIAYTAGKAGIKIDYVKARPLLVAAAKNGDASAKKMLDVVSARQKGRR